MLAGNTMNSAANGVASVVVDCESGPVRLGLAARLAAELGAEHLPLTDVTVDALTSAVGSRAVRIQNRSVA
jgi:magnesium chelatase subunit D